jgi:hypothetical protein
MPKGDNPTINTRTPTNGSALIPAAARLPSTEELEGYEAYAKTGAPIWFGELLKFSGKTGQWSYGEAAIPVEDGRILVAVVPEALAGYMLWKDGDLADQAWWPVFKFNPRQHRATLGDLDKAIWPEEDGKLVDPWKEAVMLPMVDPNTREEFTFSSSSVGGVRAVKRLINTYVKQMRAASETTKGCLQVVELGSKSYKHDDKKRGTIYNPVFEDLDWIHASDLLLPEPGSTEEPPPDDAAASEQPLPLEETFA